MSSIIDDSIPPYPLSASEQATLYDLLAREVGWAMSAAFQFQKDDHASRTVEYTATTWSRGGDEAQLPEMRVRFKVGEDDFRAGKLADAVDTFMAVQAARVPTSATPSFPLVDYRRALPAPIDA